VEQNLTFFGRLAGLGGRRLRTQVGEAAELMDLGGLRARTAQSLSGGERRRLHTSIALVHRPPVLLLDEPTVGVDVGTRQRILTAIRDLAREGVAICYSTHYLHEVE